MRTYKSIAVFLTAALFMGCSEINPTYTPPTEDQTDPTVSTGFALGADVSWTTKLEMENEKFYNAEGNARECMALMKEIGMNSIRLRVWVDPADGWCGKSDVLAKAIRAQKLGMRVMIDFHYSDVWADPAKQVVPAAWLDIAGDNAELAKKVAEHTTDVLNALKQKGVDVAWVQVGNEVTHGMLCHKGTYINDAGNEYGVALDNGGGHLEDNPENFAALITAGYDAVKSVYPEASVIVHVDRGFEAGYAESVFKVLDKNGGKYDVIGLSIYPEGLDERVSACVDNIKSLFQEFRRPVMICETGMDVDDSDTAYRHLSELIDGAKKSEHCLGVFYWEPEAPKGYNSGYNKGAFEDGKPTHALDAFTEAAKGVTAAQ